ncbi:MAG TPA: pilus assembly protein TadG-related protein [Candidatus Angelobacter sp.]|nr:pilus assembly protein TadG-related protein [Candidatus Angelobacter sp.]
MRASVPRDRHERGQVLVIVALALVVLLGASAFTVDLGRRAAEERFVQNAADAAALAACRALTTGASHSSVLQVARDVAAINLQSSPAGASPALAAAGSEEYLHGHHGNPVQLLNGAVIDGTRVRVAIRSSIDTTVGRVLGRATLDALGRAACVLEPEPTVPIVARRYANPPGPASGFVDHLATAATSGSGAVDQANPRGYDGRTPASELQPGPEFEIYGPSSKAANDSSFRGFIALDVRDFTDATSRQYYNASTTTMSSNDLKTLHQLYLEEGYPGPAFPAVASPPTGATQVGVMSGVTAGHVTQPFREGYAVGDRIMLAVYDGTVMTIPDFSIQPPVEIALSATPGTYAAGAFKVSRNDAFSSPVTFGLLGDRGAADAGTPDYDVVFDPSATPAPTPTPSPTPEPTATPTPDPSASPTGSPTATPTPTPTPDPAAGKIEEPAFSPSGIVPAKNGTTISMSDIQQNGVSPGIYAVWIEGRAGSPYFQKRRQPVPLRIGTVNRQFHLDNSVVDGTATTLGSSISLPLKLATGNGTGAWNPPGGAATPVSLSVDADSLTDCSFNPRSWGSAGVAFSSSSVWPSSGSGGTSVTMSVNTAGLASGCYLFTLRAHGVNHDGQPVVRLEQVRFTVAATTGPSEYVDIIGFAVFEITEATNNEIWGQAITGIHADPNAFELRAAQRARLVPWN